MNVMSRADEPRLNRAVSDLDTSSIQLQLNNGECVLWDKKHHRCTAEVQFMIVFRFSQINREEGPWLADDRTQQTDPHLRHESPPSSLYFAFMVPAISPQSVSFPIALALPSPLREFEY